MDLNIRMGGSIMRSYFKGLGKGADGSWLNQMPQTTLLTGAKQSCVTSNHSPSQLFVGLIACRRLCQIPCVSDF